MIHHQSVAPMDNSQDQTVVAPDAPKQKTWRQRRGWQSGGIRTRILVPLTILMIIAIVGNTISFLLSTNQAHEHILLRDLDEESQRLIAALEQSERDSRAAAELIVSDMLLLGRLLDARVRQRIASGAETLPIIEERVTAARERFKVDQAMLRDQHNRVLVNVAAADQPVHVIPRNLLPPCEAVETYMIVFNQMHMIVSCAPLITAEGQVIAYAYTILDLAELLVRLQRDLRLTGQATLVDPDTPVVETIEWQSENEMARLIKPRLGRESIVIRLQISEQSADQIIALGLSIILVGSGLALVLLFLAGAWLARSFTRPIFSLVQVAQAVTAGDLSRRSRLTSRDEIGQLGNALDRATDMIVQLLDEQAHAVRERQAILESIADGVLAVDMEERIVAFNPAASELLQQDATHMLGQSLSQLELTAPPALRAGLQQVISQVRSELYDTDLQPTEDQVALGSQIVRLQSAPILSSMGKQLGSVVIIQDITRIVESERTKTAFIGMASHELRTPLTSMKGFVDILSYTDLSVLSDEQRLYIETIQRQTNNLTLLVNDLLETARLEQGGWRLECRWVTVKQALEEAVAGLNNLITERNVNVQIEVAPRLPSIWIDPIHLERILTNLISNAVKYVYSGGDVYIRVWEINHADELPGGTLTDMPWKHDEDRSLIIAIEDNGVGIRAEDQSLIFNRFFRSDNPLSDEVGGTGLGLDIARSLVALHQGQIGFTSIEGRGSCFWVRLLTPNVDAVTTTTDATNSTSTT